VVACSSTGKSPPTCRKDSRKDCASAVSGFGIFGLSKHSSPPGTSYTPPSSATMASVSPLAFSTKPTVLSAYGGERGPVWADRSAGRTLSRAVRGVFTPFFLCQDSTGSSGGGLHGLTGSPAANPSASRTSTGGFGARGARSRRWRTQSGNWTNSLGIPFGFSRQGRPGRFLHNLD